MPHAEEEKQHAEVFTARSTPEELHPDAVPRRTVHPHEPDAPFHERGSRKWIVALGALLAVGLVLTAVAVLPWTPGRSWVPPTASFDTVVPAVETLHNDEGRPDVSTSVVQKGAAAEVARRADGPSAVITVPSAGLRSGPSLGSKALKTVVKQNEKVRILKRVSSQSGPDWVQIETHAGRTGWVWASVVKEGKGKRRG